MDRMTLGRSFRMMMRATALLAVAGCAGSQPPERAAVEIRGSEPATAGAPATTAPAPQGRVPDASGIVAYEGYEAAVARKGDTVASVAGRIGLSASELGAYNGLAPDHALREGDELVLPPRPGGYGAGPVVAAPAPATTENQFATSPATPTPAIESAPLDSTAAGAAQAPASSEAGTRTTSGGWSPDIAAAAIDRAEGFDNQGELGAPPSAEEPLPPAPQAPGQLASPQLSQYQTPGLQPQSPPPPPRPVETITTPAEESVEQSAKTELAATAPQPLAPFKLIRPVQGPIVTGFNQGAGRSRNDGIDFASPSGSPVVAAASGEVALVSQSLGGLGTIVLLRHPGDYLTVYGRIEKVTVTKGDIVNRGQKIGVVSPSPQPRMHFEVRQGAESVDPEKFF